MKPAFGYLRTSSVGQIGNDGFDRQKASIEKFCAGNGFHILRWFQDEAQTGTAEVSAREGFMQMMECAGPATTTVFVVETADRLARDLMVSELACAEARSQGFTIFESAAGTNLTDSGDPTRVLIRQMLGALSQWNKSMLVQRMRVAKNRMKAKGLRAEGRRRTTDGEAVELVLMLRGELGLGWSQISNNLNRRKIPTPQGKEWWAPSSAQFLYEQTCLRRGITPRPRVPQPKPSVVDGLAC